MIAAAAYKRFRSLPRGVCSVVGSEMLMRKKRNGESRYSRFSALTASAFDFSIFAAWSPAPPTLIRM